MICWTLWLNWWNTFPGNGRAQDSEEIIGTKVVANWNFRLYSGFELRCLDTKWTVYKDFRIRLVSLRVCSGPQHMMLYWYSRSRGNFNEGGGDILTMHGLICTATTVVV